MLTKWYGKPTTRTFPTFSVSNWFHTKKNAFLLLCSRLALLCCAKIGCGSAKQKKNAFFFCFALALHYLSIK